MSRGSFARGRLILVFVSLVAAVAAFGISSAGAGRAAKCGTITFDENAWAGATANVYVVKYVLEKNYGCKINIVKLPESTPLFQAMTDGKVDVVLEDWNNIQLKVNRHFVVKEKSVVDLGSNGVIGHIGWFIPTYLMKQHPEFKTWKGLKGKESLFKSPESGSQGMFLGGDPSYVQKDQQLIQALGLNFKFVSVGAEPAQVARWSSLYKQHKAVIFYWYTPQYLNTEYQLSEVKLPPRFKGCQDDAKAGGNPAQYKCAYDNTIINKVFSKKFATSGNPAYAALKNFKLSNEDQEIVAKWIAGDHMNPDKAGQKWIAQNSAKVKSWFGK
jgi:glycine betaine/proline transport system substrate-binding protein